MKRGNRLWLVTLCIVALLWIFPTELHYSLLAVALFLYASLPGPDAETRRARSRALRKSSRVVRKKTVKIRVVDPSDEEAILREAQECLPAASASEKAEEKAESLQENLS